VIDIVGEIVDVSKGGLMFRYIAGENRSHEPFKLDIVLAGDSFRLDKMPFKAASDTDMAGLSSFTPTTAIWGVDPRPEGSVGIFHPKLRYRCGQAGLFGPYQRARAELAMRITPPGRGASSSLTLTPY
jgi:hypothetical protein